MQVAYIETTCHCDEQGYEALTWDTETEAPRPALAHEEPKLRIKCDTCGGNRHVRTATVLDPPRAEPLTEDEWCELWQELEVLRERIRHQEEYGAGIWPELMVRLDELVIVEDLHNLEVEIEKLEHSGVRITPDLLGQREELRTKSRKLLPQAAD